MCFLYSCFMYSWSMLTSILAPCWHHFPYFLHDCFEHRFYMDLSSILQGFVYVCWSIVVDFHGPTSNWRIPQKHLFLIYFCIVYTFAISCLFQNFRDIWFVVIFCTNVVVILVRLWHQNWLFFDVDFLIISWCVFRRLLAPENDPFGVPLASQSSSKIIFSVAMLFRSPEGGFGASLGVDWSHFGSRGGWG